MRGKIYLEKKYLNRGKNKYQMLQDWGRREERGRILNMEKYTCEGVLSLSTAKKEAALIAQIPAKNKTNIIESNKTHTSNDL